MQDLLSQTFAALADPTRRAMLERLSKGAANVTDLAQPFLKEMSLPAITKHLKVLEKAGLITKTKDAQWRPCKLNGAPLRDASDWMSQYRQFWEESFDRLDEYLKTLNNKKTKSKGKKDVSKSKPNEIYIERIYDAPVKAVWDAWTDPKKAAKWWGPRGFTITTHSKDLRPGGIWHYTMHGPDGKDWINKTKYHEVETCSKLVYDHGGNDEQEPLFRVTVLFSETKGKTKMEMTMALKSEAERIETEKFIKLAGGNSTWDRLGEYLAEGKGEDLFFINRTFNAPIDLMYEVWTNPEHLVKWTGPSGFSMKYIKADIKPGGSAFYVMSDPTGQMKMYGTANYIEFSKPNRIVYTQQFSDENGNVSRHPMAPTWPETMKTTITLTQEEPNRTRVTIQWEVYGEASKEEQDTFHAAKAGMTQGWTGSLDKLEEYIATK